MQSRVSAALVTTLFFVSATASGQVNITTSYGNNLRTGWNAKETTLNTTNVSPSKFGRLFQYSVDGSVFAQPLYLSNLNLGTAGVHNVLLVVTMSDTIYAFDADQNQVLWQVSLINRAAGVTAVPIADLTGSNDLNIVGLVGIESTPVVDASTNTLYLLARTKEVTGSVTSYVQRLHALDVTSGAEKFGGPVMISGSVPGTGEASSNGVLPFDPKMQNQRAGLALAGGQVIIAWSSHEDDQPYHGWVMAYNASTLQQTGIFCDTPNGGEGGIWMSGRAPIVDSKGNVYLATGNGATNSPPALTESYLRFSSAANTLKLTDYFTASNVVSLNQADEDLASSGPLMIPGTELFAGGGKQGVLYLIDAANLGHYAAGDTQIPQKFQAVSNLIFSGPAYWQSASKGSLMFVWVQNDVLRGFSFNGSTFTTSPTVTSTVTTAQGTDPGAALSISSSGTNDSTGIVWASMTINADEDHGIVPGMLRALNASTGAELWNSQMNGARDATGAYCAKFVPPTVANGKVYVATFTDYNSPNYVDVYGLITPSPNFSLSATPPSLSVTAGNSTSTVIMVNPATGHSYDGTVSFSATNVPSGVSIAFTPESVKGASAATMTITASASAPLGTSTITATGTASSGVAHSISVVLNITDKPGAIGINFVGNGVPLTAADIAGVVPEPNWNNIAPISGTLPLNDSNGYGTSVTMTWSGENPWALPITATTPDQIMMQGYLDDQNAGVTTVSFSGLPVWPSGYTVYVYSDGDNGSNNRTATYTISGPSFTTQSYFAEDLANTNFNGTYSQVTATKQAGNYMIFTVSGSSFQLTATPVSGLRAPVNGIQIIAN